MFKSFTQDKCSQHSEQVVSWEYNLNDQSKQGMCIQCIITKNQKLTTLPDGAEKIKEIKLQMRQINEAHTQNQIQSLNELMKRVIQLQEFYCSQIEQALNEIQLLIYMLEKTSSQVDEGVKQIQTADIDSFIRQSNTIYTLNSNHQNIENNILNIIQGINNNEQFNQCQEQLALYQEKSIKFESTLNESMSPSRMVQKFKIFCPSHSDEKILLADLNPHKTLKSRLACIKCMSDVTQVKFTSLKEALYQWTQYKDNKISLLQQQNNQDFSFKEQLKQELQSFKSKINKIMTSVYMILAKNHIHKVLQQQIEEDKLRKDPSELSLLELKEISEILSYPQDIDTLKSNSKYEDYSQKKYLCKLLKFHLLFKLQKQQNQFFTNLRQIFVGEFNDISRNNNNKKKKYEMVDQQQSFQQDETCYVIALNHNSTVMIAGCNELIQTFVISRGLHPGQLLEGHESEVTALSFIGKLDQFVSGSQDNTLRFWMLDNYNQWVNYQMVYAHSNCVNQIISSKYDTLVISSSFDWTVKFWKKEQQKDKWNCSQNFKGFKSDVVSLSLNPSEQKLLALEKEGRIIVLEELDEVWIKIQVLLIDNWGYRLCFINDNMFSFQPQNNSIMKFFHFQFGKFVFIKDLQIDGGGECSQFFIQTYNQEQRIILSKNGKCINIIQHVSGTEFELQQSLVFDTSEVVGVLTEDGDYLITWDGTIELQIIMNYQRKMNIDDKAKHRLSQDCRDNFLQFLLVQRAGKQGDVNMLNHIKSVYPKQLKAKILKYSSTIAYLKNRDESEKDLRQQAKFILTSRKYDCQTERPRSRLDELVKRPVNVSPRCLLTTVDKFNI